MLINEKDLYIYIYIFCILLQEATLNFKIYIYFVSFSAGSLSQL
jgi:hypothetical protein